MRTSLSSSVLCFFFFVLGVFVGCVLLSLYLRWQEPLEVAVVMSPIEVHLFLETPPGTDVYIDRKIWEIAH